MKAKKLILMSVVVLLVVALTAGTALAGSPWQDKGNKGKGNNKGDKVQVKVEKQVKIQKQIKLYDFSDVSPNHWACKRIKAMAKKGIIKGYGHGQFRPNASVSNIEALTMIVRFSQEVDADDLKDAAKDAKYFKGIPLWARGYVAIALEEEILDKDDLDNYRPNAAAKRADVVILLGRALDVDIDDDYEDLDFKDLKQIPEEALDYLPYLVEEGYITGYNNGKFMPNKPVTRAELANILAKIDADVDEDDEEVDVDILDQYKAVGKITDLEDDSLVLKIKNTEKEFSIDDDVVVFVDCKDADYEDLEEGFKAIVLYDKNDGENQAQVIYARSCDKDDDDEDDDDAEVEEVEGLFLSANDDTIKVLVDGNKEKYDLSEEVEVEIDSDEADLEDLLPGMEVELTIEDDEVVEIKAEELVDIKGEFVSYDEDDDELVIEVDGEEFTFDLVDEVEVEIDGDEADLEALDEGMELELTFEDGEVVKIEARD